MTIGPDPITIAVRMSPRLGILSLPFKFPQEMSAHQRIRSPMEASRGNRNPKGETLLRVLRILAFATPVVALMAFLAYQQGIGWTPLDCEFTRTWEDCNWDWLNPLLWGPWPHRSADYPNGLGLIARALWWL